VKPFLLVVLVPLLGLPSAALSADSHRQAVLRLVAVSGAIAEEVRALQDKGQLAIEAGSRMPAGECGQFFQDLVALKNLEVVDRVDPAFREWREDGRRQVAGTVVLRWRGKQELRLRVQTMGSHRLEAPDAAGTQVLCSVRTVAADEWRDGSGKLSPLLIDLPGTKGGKPRVFPVAVDRAPPGQPLAKE
jgi:hypothetical protein